LSGKSGGSATTAQDFIVGMSYNNQNCHASLGKLIGQYKKLTLILLLMVKFAGNLNDKKAD
jgi:hypothetical protein